MRMALIDDGVLAQQLPSPSIVESYLVPRHGPVRPRRASDEIFTSHGLFCAQILGLYAPKAKLVSLQVFDRPDLTASCTQLLSALDFCLAQGYPLINLSLGSCQFIDHRPIKERIAALSNAGQVLVAAVSHRKRYTLPASLPQVYAVSAKTEAPSQQPWDLALAPHPLHGALHIRAKATHRLGKDFLTEAANSYAAPYLSACLYHLLAQGQKGKALWPALQALLASQM